MTETVSRIVYVDDILKVADRITPGAKFPLVEVFKSQVLRDSWGFTPQNEIYRLVSWSDVGDGVELEVVSSRDLVHNNREEVTRLRAHPLRRLKVSLVGY